MTVINWQSRFTWSPWLYRVPSSNVENLALICSDSISVGEKLRHILAQMAQNIHRPNESRYKVVDDQSIEQHVESGGLVAQSELFVEVDNETPGEIVQKVDQANVKSLIQSEHTSAISAVNGGRTFAVLCSVPHKILDAEEHQGDDQQQEPSERIHQCQALHGVEGIVDVLVGAQQVEV